MSALLLSDIHLEFGNGAENLISPPTDDVDLLIFAGDISCGTSAFSWMAEYANGREVIYVAGNHEYYGHKFPDLIDEMREAANEHPNIHFLECDSYRHNGITYLGCTLWTDFALFGSLEWSLYECRSLADFSKIKRDCYLLSPEHVREYHLKCRQWLQSELERLKGERVAVVTHHLPLWDAVPDIYYRNPLTPAFASDLRRIIDDYAPEYWFCGHTHEKVDITYKNTRVMAKPMGYLFEANYPEGYEGLKIEGL